MLTIRGTVKNGQLVPNGPLPFDFVEGMSFRAIPDLVEEKLGLDEDEWPTTPEGIAKLVELIQSPKGPWLSADDQKAWDKAKADERAWEFA